MDDREDEFDIAIFIDYPESDEEIEYPDLNEMPEEEPMKKEAPIILKAPHRDMPEAFITYMDHVYPIKWDYSDIVPLSVENTGLNQ